MFVNGQSLPLRLDRIRRRDRRRGYDYVLDFISPIKRAPRANCARFPELHEREQGEFAENSRLPSLGARDQPSWPSTTIVISNLSTI
jgi:hypothetical protein